MPRRALLRLAIGVAISAVLLGATVARVDLAATAEAIGRAAPLGLALGVAVVLVDLALRAARWWVLLDGADDAGSAPSYRLALAYLSVGFAANAVLPARLGDVARAILAGTAFGLPRLAVLGTIIVERVADGATMLGLVLLSSVAVARIAELDQLARLGAIAATAGTVVLIAGWLALSRAARGRMTMAGRVAAMAQRVTVGAAGLRSTRHAALVLALTAVVASTAILGAWTVAQSVGVPLAPTEAVLFMSGVALSLAIPAAPGSLGTYEFVGVTILTALGYSAELGLATMVLMRVVMSFPPSICGVIALLALNIRPRTLVASGG